MNSKKKVILAAVAFVLVLGIGAILYPYLSDHFQLTSPLTQQEDTTETRTPAPNVSFEDSNGNIVQLDDFKGKIIVMNFWSSQCNPCKMEMPDMQKAYEAYQGEVEFVMINVLDAMYDTKETANAYIAENNYTFPVYFDTQFNAIQTYGVYSFPTTYVIDQEGNLYGRAIGVLSYEALTDALDDLLA